MKLYRIKLNKVDGCVWDNIPDTIETVKNLLEEMDFKDGVAIDLVQMTTKEYETLPEFQGWQC